MAKDSASPEPGSQPKRHLGAQSVSGIRRSTGRTAPVRPEHYLDRATSRALGHEIDAALADRDKRRSSTAPAHAGKPATVGEHRARIKKAEEARRARVAGPAMSLTREQRSARTVPVFILAALDDADLSANQFRVYAHIARHADNPAGQAACLVEIMARKCKMNADTMRACLKSLFARRMIEADDRPGYARVYRLLDPAMWVVPSETGGVVGNEGTPPPNPVDPPVAPRKRRGFPNLNFRRFSDARG